MKTTPASLILFVGALALAGCTDGNVTKRDDGRYVTIPANKIVPAATTDAPTTIMPGETGRKLSPDKAYATTVVAEDGPQDKKQRESQEKFEDELTKLDSK